MVSLQNCLRITKTYAAAYTLLFVVLSVFVNSTAFANSSSTISLIAPLGSGCSGGVPIGTGGFDIMFNYFRCSASWLYDVAIGVCVLWTLIGGIQIIVSGDNSGWYERGKNVIIASIVGLLMLLFAPVILKFLNSAFFV